MKAKATQTCWLSIDKPDLSFLALSPSIYEANRNAYLYPDAAPPSLVQRSAINLEEARICRSAIVELVFDLLYTITVYLYH